MANALRNLLALLRVVRDRSRVYSLPAYALGLYLGRRNAGSGPVAWLRGLPPPRIDNNGGGAVDIGHAALYPGVRLQCRQGGRIAIGDGSFINHDTRIRSRTSVEIGTGCMVSWDVLITDTTADSAARSVSIGDRCWIGAKALLLGGTRLGDDCIVAAGSIVQGHFEPGRIIAGKPAKTLDQTDQTDQADQTDPTDHHEGRSTQ